MNAIDIIRKKRDRGELSQKEINFFITGLCQKTIPDYQVSSWLMACTLNGLQTEEIFHLTQAMRESGDTFNWRQLSPQLKSHKFADKHSTGGIGDKVSLVLAPLAACVGLTVPMMSGRGLGHTGGTVDKLESIAGFNLYLNRDQMLRCLEEHQVLMMAQSDSICPADKILYALRDVSGTVESVGLITASIVSKKWAEGVDSILFDVKFGSAAFMPTLAKAKELASSLIATSQKAGLRASAALTRMEEPLGWAIGNALEIEECLEILSDNYQSPRRRELSAPLKELCIDLVAKMSLEHQLFPSFEEAKQQTQAKLSSHQALERFYLMLKAQGADPNWQNKQVPAHNNVTISSPASGYIHNIHSKNLGLAGRKIKMGRYQLSDSLDYASGYELFVRPGDYVSKGDPLLSIKHNLAENIDDVVAQALPCFEIAEHTAPHPQKLLLDFL